MGTPLFQQTQKQTTGLILAPQMRQSLKILQASTLELRNILLEEIATNPTLEELPIESISLEAADQPFDNKAFTSTEAESPTSSKELEILRTLNDDWNASVHYSNTLLPYTAEDASRRQYFFNSLAVEASLQEHLMQQINLSNCTEDEHSALVYLVGSLDDRGYLTLPVEEIAQHAHVLPPVVERARELLKNLEPTGLGCYDLQECLLHQLKVRGQEESLPATIIREYYPLFLRRRVPELARKLNASLKAVQEAFEAISTLDPAPGRRFSLDTNRSITPDVIVQKENGAWSVSLNNQAVPRLAVSPLYKSIIAQQQLSPKTKEYIKDKIQSGRLLIHALAQRQHTIERIAQQLLEVQKDFFEHGVSRLSPLTMEQMAQALQVHETTISRAVANKYMLTPHGLFPLKYFFANGYQQGEHEAVASTSIKEKIAHLIQQEDPNKPYSDQEIANMLKQNAITIARRTVAKYREEAGILATHLRRQYSP